MKDEHTPGDGLPRDLCPRLRTKSMNLNTDYQRTEWDERIASDVAIYWCTVTMAPHGPDEADATPECCRPGRGCYRGIVDIT